MNSLRQSNNPLPKINIGRTNICKKQPVGKVISLKFQRDKYFISYIISKKINLDYLPQRFRKC